MRFCRYCQKVYSDNVYRCPKCKRALTEIEPNPSEEKKDE
jgi:hypothetical protein